MTAADRIKTFFKRGPYRGEYRTTPLWHRYATYDKTERTVEGLTFPERSLTISALCGYQATVRSALSGDGVGFSSFDWKAEVKTKKLRCSKCDAKAAASAP